MSEALMSTDLPLPNKRTGKVRDLYDLTLNDGTAGILIIASDRVSVFDVVLENGIPGKGVLLTQISNFWFDHFSADFAHHLISTDPADIAGLSDDQRKSLEGRIMICRKSEVVPIECIVRGYLTGSGYKDYQKTGEVCGIALPEGMINSDRIESPIFTPSTKPEEGHDENISFETACDLVGMDVMNELRDTSMAIYNKGRDYALKRGIIIADTKFEFGWNPDREIVLIDEVLTPDSSRFWPADDWEPGKEQNSFDKQYVRNYTETLVSAGEWNKEYPGPSLPDDVIADTIARYEEALHRLTD
ncbi:MAG: phosphoribosylaminoimidazolesuccinocarboxamide synthase [Gammaproteobacteria bacterium]|jgi:phosphoribosylaminoimidazole-succinocarboxamide synthase|nr:phosphoribosylaminoimidazolesuccinocarboxamide synthase [Gammaproteobacteria bacterium]MBT4492603.1 phosphoribosylaminoimidazolesuccinocarboxamide synthase [Gammaproteobacteria bacterium]MBT7371350.1 phosphoribosylaminoimidazolesuccinocarboxamide synthase [Gammaproteobacteria bacterium]